MLGLYRDREKETQRDKGQDNVEMKQTEIQREDWGETETDRERETEEKRKLE